MSLSAKTPALGAGLPTPPPPGLLSVFRKIRFAPPNLRLHSWHGTLSMSCRRRLVPGDVHGYRLASGLRFGSRVQDHHQQVELLPPEQRPADKRVRHHADAPSRHRLPRDLRLTSSPPSLPQVTRASCATAALGEASAKRKGRGTLPHPEARRAPARSDTKSRPIASSAAPPRVSRRRQPGRRAWPGTPTRRRAPPGRNAGPGCACI